jgi:hypothetical protein
VNIGDIVTVTLKNNPLDPEYQAVVIGSPHYAPDRSVLVVASPDFIGMPINRSWCRPFSTGHEAEGRVLREAFEARHPGWLLPENGGGKQP